MSTASASSPAPQEAESQQAPAQTGSARAEASSPAEEKSSQRNYIILSKQQNAADTFKVIGSRISSSAESAVRALGEDVLSDGSTYVAVPERNWSPITVSIEKTTQIKLS